MKNAQKLPMLKPNINLYKKRISAEERLVDYEVEFHWHNYVEIELIISGSAYHLFNGEEIPLQKGVLTFSRDSDYHYIKPYEDITLLNLSFSKDMLSKSSINRLEQMTSGICTMLDEETFETVEILIRFIIKECKKDVPPPDNTYISHLLECVFAKLITQKNATLPSHMSYPIQQAISYLNSHFTENPSMEQVAKLVHYHPKHFCTVFHRETEVTYTEYLANLKVDYAKSLLITTALGLDHICANCGFGSMVTFRRVFKQHCGMTPLKYREKAKKF